VKIYVCISQRSFTPLFAGTCIEIKLFYLHLKELERLASKLKEIILMSMVGQKETIWKTNVRTEGNCREGVGE
jgi:hypothetical protein